MGCISSNDGLGAGRWVYFPQVVIHGAFTKEQWVVVSDRWPVGAVSFGAGYAALKRRSHTGVLTAWHPRPVVAQADSRFLAALGMTKFIGVVRLDGTTEAVPLPILASKEFLIG